MDKEEKVTEFYCDGIGKIHFIGGMIKLDMFSFDPIEGEEKPTPRLTQRVVMSPNGFLSAYDAFYNMVKKLTDAGILAKNEAEPIVDKEETTPEVSTETINGSEAVPEGVKVEDATVVSNDAK